MGIEAAVPASRTTLILNELEHMKIRHTLDVDMTRIIGQIYKTGM